MSSKKLNKNCLAISIFFPFLRSLHSFCQLLIALESFFGIFLNLNYFVSFVLSLIGQPFIKFVPCFWIQILSIITGNNAQMTMVLIGFDRLFAVKLPIW
uniref:7TM GPCR serpentine receptor class x (Srx) domain-containing protein n=1 Tax=Meloidogyne incognita TaxID=6306 RepID=A0A914NMR4_MELIC